VNPTQIVTVLPSSDDIKLSARDAVKHLIHIFGPLPAENIPAAEKLLANFLYENPPTGPDQGPCNHGYDNKYWCARCQGKIGEDFQSISDVTSQVQP
jgi:hypothetical protein